MCTLYLCMLYVKTHFLLIVIIKSKKIEEAISNITLISDNKLKMITDQHNETIIKLNIILANQKIIIEKLEEKSNINYIETYASITSENITTILK